jgi:hypothetical protein
VVAINQISPQGKVKINMGNYDKKQMKYLNLFKYKASAKFLF